MKITTTTHLKFPRARWYDLSTPAAASLTIFLLLLIALIVGRIRSAQQAVVVPTPAIIIIATPAPRPAPTAAAAAPMQIAAVRYVPGFDRPNGNVMGAIPEPAASAIVARWGDEWLETTHDNAPIWIRAADMGMSLANVAPVPQLQPQVVYVSSPPYAVPTPTEGSYTIANAPPDGDFYTSAPQVSPAFQESLIDDSRPNELACGGSPMCGGLTNAQARAALNAQRAAHP